MKTELRCRPHLIRKDDVVFEVWYNGFFVAEIVGSDDGAGVKVISNHALLPKWHPGGSVQVAEIRVAVDKAEV